MDGTESDDVEPDDGAAAPTTAALRTKWLPKSMFTNVSPRLNVKAGGFAVVWMTPTGSTSVTRYATAGFRLKLDNLADRLLRKYAIDYVPSDAILPHAKWEVLE